ncbi:cytochrome P450 [Ramicandelaber brevisporus]|nr:cytochrome P450 [Ramicandelaber brevisporus]
MLIDRLALLDEKQPAETVNGRGKDNEDILNALIDAMQQDETGLVTLDVLVRNVIGMYTAAHDTTAAALTMAIAELGRNPDIQERARKHVFDIMGDPANDEEDAGAVPTAEQQRQMTYLTMIIKETLRMWPSVPVVPARRSVPGPSGEECVLSDGTVVPCGMRLNISVVAIHRNPKYWPEPHVFNPERFASDTSDSLLSNSPETVAWMPFGGGTRACAGAQASLVQQRVVLAMLLRKFRWTTPPEMFLDDGLPRLAPGIILSPTAMSAIFTLL